jgi:hypothetical protein
LQTWYEIEKVAFAVEGEVLDDTDGEGEKLGSQRTWTRETRASRNVEPFL